MGYKFFIFTNFGIGTGLTVTLQVDHRYKCTIE